MSSCKYVENGTSQALLYNRSSERAVSIMALQGQSIRAVCWCYVIKRGAVIGDS